MERVVFKLDIHDDRTRQKAKKTVSRLSGVDSVEMEDQKMTVTGDIDPIIVVRKLSKFCLTEIVSIHQGPPPRRGLIRRRILLESTLWMPSTLWRHIKLECSRIMRRTSSNKTEGLTNYVERESESDAPEYMYMKAYRAYNPHIRMTNA